MHAHIGLQLKVKNWFWQASLSPCFPEPSAIMLLYCLCVCVPFVHPLLLSLSPLSKCTEQAEFSHVIQAITDKTGVEITPAKIYEAFQNHYCKQDCWKKRRRCTDSSNIPCNFSPYYTTRTDRHRAMCWRRYVSPVLHELTSSPSAKSIMQSLIKFRMIVI